MAWTAAWGYPLQPGELYFLFSADDLCAREPGPDTYPLAGAKIGASRRFRPHCDFNRKKFFSAAGRDT